MKLKITRERNGFERSGITVTKRKTTFRLRRDRFKRFNRDWMLTDTITHLKMSWKKLLRTEKELKRRQRKIEREKRTRRERRENKSRARRKRREAGRLCHPRRKDRA